MREIKFRAWAVNSKEMFYPNTEDGWEMLDGEIIVLPNTVLMQYTGLKDKNGKEIYEGDIVKHYELSKDLLNKKVEINKENYRIQIIAWNDFYCGFYTFMGNTCCEGLYEILSSSYEIIGNIYENKDLLKN